MGARIELGRYGEDVAVRYLISRGMAVIERNWRCRSGEIDVVAIDGRTLVICEVKTRRSARFGSPADAVTPAKLARLRRLAGLWVRERGDCGIACDRLRIDVVAVTRPRRGPAQISHLRGVS